MNDESFPMRLGEQVLDLLNRGSREDSEEFLDTVLSGHRTLMQLFFDRVVLESIRKVSSKDFPFDDRNAASKRIAGELMEVLRDNFLASSRLPFI